MMEAAGNADTNGGYPESPETKEIELATTIAELETTLEKEGGEAGLETNAAWFSARSEAAKVGWES